MRPFFFAAIAALSLSAAHSAANDWYVGLTVPQETVQRYLSVTSKLTRYPRPGFIPTVVVISDEEATKAVGYPVYGFVRYDRPQIVYLNVDIPVELRPAVLVHELTHVLQSANGHIPNGTCIGFQSNELEAHAASTRFLALIGRGNMPLALPNFSCQGKQ